MFSNAQEFAVEINYLMDMLGIKDHKRVIQIFRTAIDPTPFVKGVIGLSKKSPPEVIKVLEREDFFRPILANYLLRRITPEQKLDYKDWGPDVTVDPGSYSVGMTPPASVPGNPLFYYLDTMRASVPGVPFVFRDNMRHFTAGFLGVPCGSKDDPDLQAILERLEGFLTDLDLGKIRYVITSGIGANEMYSRELALILDLYFINSGIDTSWIVVNNPAHLKIIPPEANDRNSVIFEMSRSGGTKETVDFFNTTRERFKKRIIVANKGRLKELGAQLQKEPHARVLIIDNTRGDIGGRQMNRKTLMVYAPLFVALAAGLKSIDAARAFLSGYCGELTRANDELAYTMGPDSPAITLAEFIFSHRCAGRIKFSILYDDILRYSAKELIQLLNEGGNKNVAGGTNNNILNGYALTDDSRRYETVFNADPGRQLPIFLLDRKRPDHDSKLAYAHDLRKRGIPCIVFSAALTGDLMENLRIAARISALLQDMVIYFTYLTNQDANSNPAVKFVREITAAMFEIIKEKKSGSRSDVRVTFSDVSDKVGQKQEAAKCRAKEVFDSKNIQRQDYDPRFNPLTDAIGSVASKLSCDEGDVATLLTVSASKNVLMTDIGEAGESKISDIAEAFARSKLLPALGELTPAPQIEYLNRRRVIDLKERAIRVSFAVAKEADFEPDPSRELSVNIANYFFTMYRTRKNSLQYMPLTFMEIDSDNPVIGEISDHIVGNMAGAGISSPLLPLPGVAHSGIEAVMSHPENIFNIAIVYTDTYGPPLGATTVEENITIDDATYVYGIANVIRMALGGSPSVIFEAPDDNELTYIEGVLDKALRQLGNMIVTGKG